MLTAECSKALLRREAMLEPRQTSSPSPGPGPPIPQGEPGERPSCGLPPEGHPGGPGGVTPPRLLTFRHVLYEVVDLPLLAPTAGAGLGVGGVLAAAPGAGQAGGGEGAALPEGLGQLAQAWAVGPSGQR
jgi:hypothetical protein